MSKQFPKLQAKLDEIQIRLNEVLRAEFIDVDTDPIEDVELKISVRNFITHSATTKLSSALRESLKASLEPTAKVTLEDVAAAQALLKLGRDHEIAIKVLTKALERQIQPQESRDSAKETKESKNLAIKALSECAAEITKFDSIKLSRRLDGIRFFYDELANDEINDPCETRDGVTCCQKSNGRWKNTSNGKVYNLKRDCFNS